MLAAERGRLEAHGINRKAVILDKELNWLYRDITTVMTQSALMTGFAMQAINTQQNADANLRASIEYGQDDHETRLLVMETVCLLFSSTSVCCNLICVFQSLFLLTWGPNQALRGSMHDMEDAVYGLREERIFLLRMFLIGVVAFIPATASYCFLFWDNRAAAIVLPLYVFTLVYLLLRYHRVRKRFNGPTLFPWLSNMWASSANLSAEDQVQGGKTKLRMKADPQEQQVTPPPLTTPP
jgi:small-conductance mechanosensitive channel